MKTLEYIALLFFLAAAFLFVGLLTGCATVDKLYDQQVVETPGPMVTNVVYRTNVTILEFASTNEAGIITPAKAEVFVQPEYIVTRGAPVLKTNLVPRDSVSGVIQASGAVPAPWAGAMALGLGWLYSAYASFRNKQVAKALVQSVQVGREFLRTTPEGQKIDAEMKAKLQRHQQYLGVAHIVKVLLDKYVPEHTQKV